MNGPGWNLADLELSEAAREYVDGLPVSGGPAAVLAAYGRRSRSEALEELAAKKRQEAILDARQEMLEAARYAGGDLRSELAPLLDYEVACAIADATEERNRQAAAEARTADLDRRLAQAREQLKAESKRSERLSRNLTAANTAAGVFKDRAERQQSRWR
jgi:hypothetical protein